MTALKAHQVDGFIRRVDPDCPVVLVYGPDRGSVSERTRAVVEKTAGSLDDPFTLARIDERSIQEDPARIEDEARAIPMLGGTRVVWVSGAGAATAAALERYLSDPASGALVVVEAGNLQKSAKLRTVVERSKTAVALPCYADSGRSLDEVIESVLATHGLVASPEARHRLMDLLGADRSLTRSELEKLALYCAGKDRVEFSDVEAVCGDTSALEIDRVVDATFEGNLSDQDLMLQRLQASGTAPQILVAAFQAHISRLRRARHARDTGVTSDDAIARLRPPVHFTRKGSLKRQLTLWDRKALRRAAEAIGDLERESRRSDGLVETLVARHLLVLGRAAAVRGRQTR